MILGAFMCLHIQFERPERGQMALVLSDKKNQASLGWVVKKLSVIFENDGQGA